MEQLTSQCLMICTHTVYAVHLGNIKFGELECNANWRAFNLANRVNKN